MSTNYPTLSTEKWYPWPLIAIAISATTFPLIAHSILALGWGRRCGGLIQRAVSIRFLTLALVIATGMWIGGVVLLVASDAQTSVVNFQLRSTTDLLGTCFGGARRVQDTAVNVSLQSISEVSANLSLQMVQRITDQLGARLFNSVMTPFSTTDSFRIGQSLPMDSQPGLLSIGELLWLSAVPTPVTQLFVANSNFNTIIFYHTELGFAALYDRTKGSYYSYSFNKADGRIAISDKCYLPEPGLCAASGYTSPPLQEPPTLTNVSQPVWTHVFGVVTDVYPYLAVYYPVMQGPSCLGWFGQQVKTQPVQDILQEYCGLVSGSFAYIVDENEVLLAVSNGVAYVVAGNPQQARPISVYSEQVKSDVVASLAKYVKSRFGSHWQTPQRFAFLVESTSAAYATLLHCGTNVHKNS